MLRDGYFIALTVAALGCHESAHVRSHPEIQGGATGAWWLSQPTSVRYGFVVGVVDCFFGDVGGTSILGDSSYESSVARTTAYFDGAPGRTKEGALGVLLGGSKADTSGGPRRGWHENWNGNYWINMDPSEQLGFVEGYVTCYRTFVPNGMEFTRFRGRLVVWVSSRMGVKPLEGDG
jgi:hypothetical protein